MPSTFWFDKSRVLEAARHGLEEGLNEAAERVAADAKRRAPIRKAFKEAKGFRRKFRSLTNPERTLAIARSVNYYTNVKPDQFALRRSVAHIQNYARAEVPRRGSANSASRSRKVRILGVERGGRFFSSSAGTTRSHLGGFEPGAALAQKLTARGRYEVRTGRSVHRELSSSGTAARVQIGGALKASIGAGPVHETATGMEVEVEAAIRYAKYVEFPTIRTAAQPFLLPALAQERQRLPQTIADAIRKNLGG